VPAVVFGALGVRLVVVRQMFRVSSFSTTLRASGCGKGALVARLGIGAGCLCGMA